MLETTVPGGAAGGQVLFVTFAKASLLETLPVARALVAGGALTPLYYLNPKHAGATAPILGRERLKAIGPEGEAYVPEAAPEDARASAEDDGDPEEAGLRTVRRKAYSLLPGFARSLRHFRGLGRTARSILDRLPSVRALLLISDRKVGIETAFVRAANERGIPSLIVPFADSFPEALAEVRIRDAESRKKHLASGPWRRFLAWRFPGWIFRHKGQDLFYSPPGDLLAAKFCRMMPRNPWTLGGGFATRMTVDSERSREVFERQGIPPAKLVVTGRPSADDIARTLREADAGALRRELGIPEGRRIVLCGVPQLAEHGLLSWEKHWEEMDFLFRTLASSGAAAVLSLHPRSDPALYRERAARAGAIVASRRVYEILPACDVFVAHYSSIVAQAVALKKPCVVVDFYGLGYPVFDTAPGTTVVRARDAFAPVLKRLLDDPAFYEEQRRRQEQEGGRWAILDGGCTNRVVDELLKLVRKRC